MDFDFNHNALFDSTVEHAESRLVRRLFALNQIYAPWHALADGSDSLAPQISRNRQHRNVFATATSNRPVPTAPTVARLATEPDIEQPIEYASLLKDVTIYTSLESCAQCSGIMCLASVKDIVYLQWDQGQFLIGNIIRNATLSQPPGFLAPRPIRGDQFGFEYFTMLNDANDTFSREVASEPFYTRPDGTHRETATTPSVTSFLCIDDAKAIFEAADEELSGWMSVENHHAPGGYVGFTNQQVLDQARDFRVWANQLTNRGAPHRV
jgi:hypothetical protein